MCGGFKHPQQGWILSGHNKDGQVRILESGQLVENGKPTRARWLKIDRASSLEGFGRFEGNARLEKLGEFKLGGTVPEKGPWWRRQVVVVPATEVFEYSEKYRGCITFPVQKGQGLVAVKGCCSFAVVTRPAPREYKGRFGIERLPLTAPLA